MDDGKKYAFVVMAVRNDYDKSWAYPVAAFIDEAAADEYAKNPPEDCSHPGRDYLEVVTVRLIDPK